MTLPNSGRPESTLGLARRAHPWRDIIEGVLTALVLALIIRHFVFEVFQIPTGSMAPTLVGQHRDLVCPNCRYPFAVDNGPDSLGRRKPAQDVYCPNCRYILPAEQVKRHVCSCFPAWPRRFFWKGGNRVIVNKFMCHFCQPERWNIIVFRHPTDAKNLIKRLVGLPGESVLIKHGDIYIDDKLERKAKHVQDAFWRIVFDSAYVPQEIVGWRGRTWHPDAGKHVEDEDGGLELTPGPGGAARVWYRPKIMDSTGYNGSWDGQIRAGDLRWDLSVRLETPGVLRVGLMEDNENYEAVIPFVGGNARAALTVNGRRVADCGCRAEPGIEHHILFSNVDDSLQLSVDGSVVLTHTWEVPLQRVKRIGVNSGASLAVAGAVATFSRIRLERDVYYAGEGEAYLIPDDSYFVLGDNTRQSYDSRSWGTLTADRVLGRAVVVWWPLDHLRPAF